MTHQQRHNRALRELSLARYKMQRAQATAQYRTRRYREALRVAEALSPDREAPE